LNNNCMSAPAGKKVEKARKKKSSRKKTVISV